MRISVVFPQFDEWGFRVEKKLDKILAALKDGSLTPAQVEQIGRIAAKVEAISPGRLVESPTNKKENQ